MELQLHNSNMLNSEDDGFTRYAQNFSLLLRPESSIYLPLKSCFFDKARSRPWISLDRSKSGFEDSTTGLGEEKYEWTEAA